MSVWDYEDILKCTDGKSDETFITKFQFGSVYRGKIGDQDCTVKIWDGDDLPNMLVEEIAVRTDVHTKGVCKFLACTDLKMHQRPQAIVYDFSPLDSLQNLIPKDDFSWPNRIKVSLGLASILRSFHTFRVGYIISNVDAAHVMCDQEYNPILYDFSMVAGAVFGHRWKYDKRWGSRGYTDPYLFDKGIGSVKTDVFAFGVILLGLISKKVFNAETDGDSDFVNIWAETEYYHKGQKKHSLVNKSLRSSPYFNDTDGQLITILAMRCIKYDPDKRPTMEEVVRALERLEIVKTHSGIKPDPEPEPMSEEVAV